MIDVNNFAVRMDLYKGTEFIKTFYCPKFYSNHYFGNFLYKDSPYKIIYHSPTGQIEEISITTITSFQLS